MTDTRLDELIEFYETYYRDEIARLAQSYPRDDRSLVVDWMDIYQYWPDYAHDLRENPTGDGVVSPLSELHEALYEIELAADISFESEQWQNAHVRIKLPDRHKLGVGQLRARDNNSLVAVSGQIERVTQATERITTAEWECAKCSNRVSVPQPKDTLQKPSRCSGSCSGKPSWTLKERECVTVDERKLKLTQPPEDSSGSGAELSVLLSDDLAFADGEQSLMDMAGERVTIHGKLKRDKSDTRGRNAKPVFGRYLKAHHVEFDGTAMEQTDIDEHKDEIDRHVSADDTLERLIASTAPYVEGGKRMRQIKRGIVLFLFRASRKQVSDGGSLRGDIHLGMIGDPSTGKTQLLDFIESVSPRIERLSGTDSTGVGLTASATQDEFAGGDWVLEPGVLPRASGGHAIIDEIDKMDDGIDKLHEALETQRVHVSKAGMNAELKTECGVVVAANPTDGRFSGFDKFVEEIDLPPALFSRFDILHTLRDQPDEEIDGKVAGAVLDKWQRASEEDDDTVAPVSTGTYRAWIARAQDINPELSDEAKNRIQDWYTTERNENWDDYDDVIPVTARSVAATARLAEAHARLNLRETVTVDDAEIAVDVIKCVMGDVYLDDEGNMDVDTITEAKSMKQRKEGLKRYIREHGPVDIDDLHEELDTAENVLNHDIDQLKQKGILYEPQTGRIDVA